MRQIELAQAEQAQRSQDQGGQQTPSGAVIDTTQQSVPTPEMKETGKQAVPNLNLDNRQHAMPSSRMFGQSSTLSGLYAATIMR
jgi:hypothetical protein